MNKLELKHLAPYLPYKLNVVIYEGWPAECIKTLMGISFVKILTIRVNHYNTTTQARRFKLILRPLSDSTKEIEVNGKKFVPMVELSKIIHNNTKLVTYSVMDNLGYYGILCDWGINFETNLIYYQEIKSWYVKVNGKVCTQYDTYNLFQKLFEWHFDVFNLIPEGLAVDVNTISMKHKHLYKKDTKPCDICGGTKLHSFNCEKIKEL